MKKLFTLILSMTLVFSLAACSEEDDTIEIGYATWVDGIAMTHLTAAILEDEMGYENVETTQADLGPIFSDLSQGNIDLMLHAWLPATHATYQEQFSDDWENLGISYEGARIGLVVPEYVTIESITELNQAYEDGEFDEHPEIVGIEPGSGIMDVTKKEILDAYSLDMDLLNASGPAMVQTLGNAIAKDEWVVVTGWTPHYMFAEYDLKFLDDPQNIYGGAENIVSIGRSGMTQDHPDIAQLLDNMYLTDTQFGEIAGLISNDEEDTPYIDLAREWMADNEDVWSEWIPEDSQ